MRAQWGALLALGLLACQTRGLPDYARPTGALVNRSDQEDRLAAADFISYRELTRDDFKAAGPPEYFGAHAAKIGAATCVTIMATGELSARIQLRPAGDYEARLVAPEFLALMARNCS